MNEESSTESDRSLQESAYAGVRWSGGAHVLKQLLKLGIGLLLMRLLSPKAFGIIGMAAVVTGLLTVVSNLGLGSAIVQRRDLRAGQLSVAFWATVCLGIVLAGLAAGSATGVAKFFQEPDLEPILQTLSLIFVFGAVGVVPKALLQRDMDFSSLARVEVPAIALAGLIAVLFAWWGGGVWSLVVQRLATPALEAAAVWMFVGWHPKTRFSLRGIRELANYGLNLTGFHFVNYCARHADDMLIGRLMGSTSLGLYDRAYSLMLLPITQVIRSVNRVVFPTLAAIQEDREHMRSIYLRVARVLSIVCFPLMIGLAIVADPFVRGVLGQQWTGMIPVVRILCLVGVIQTLANPTGWIYTATGRTDWMMWWGVASAAVLVGSIVAGVLIGSIEAVAWTYAGGNLLLLYPTIAIPGKLIDMEVAHVARTSAPAAVVSILMGAILLGLRNWLFETWSPIPTLSVLVPLGVLLYAGLSLVLHREGCRECLRVVAGVIPSTDNRMSRLERYL